MDSARHFPGAPSFWRRVSIPEELAPGACWIGPRRGYLGRTRGQRYAWEQLIGPVPPGFSLFANCADKRCVNPDHHRPIEDGMGPREAVLLGRVRDVADMRGGMNPRAELRDEDVLFIRSQRREYGITLTLAALFGVDVQIVRRVRRRVTWTHLGNGNKRNAMSLPDLRALAERRARERYTPDHAAERDHAAQSRSAA